MSTLGTRIKAARILAASDESRSRFTLRHGLNAYNVSRHEQDAFSPRIQSFAAFCRAAGRSMDSVYYGLEPSRLEQDWVDEVLSEGCEPDAPTRR